MVVAVGPYVNATEQAAHEILDEMRSMAEVILVSPVDLMAHNAAEQLDQATERFRCNVFGATPAGTAEGKILLGHNEGTTTG